MIMFMKVMKYGGGTYITESKDDDVSMDSGSYSEIRGNGFCR